jgi:hypothetical protein
MKQQEEDIRKMIQDIESFFNSGHWDGQEF